MSARQRLRPAFLPIPARWWRRGRRYRGLAQSVGACLSMARCGHCGLPDHHHRSAGAWPQKRINSENCYNAIPCPSLRSFNFLSRRDDYRRWMRDRVRAWLHRRHDNARPHSDNTWVSDLLGRLDKGLFTMLQASQTHRARVQALRWRTSLSRSMPTNTVGYLPVPMSTTPFSRFGSRGTAAPDSNCWPWRSDIIRGESRSG